MMKVFKFFCYVILGILIMLIFRFVLVLIMRMVTIFRQRWNKNK